MDESGNGRVGESGKDRKKDIRSYRDLDVFQGAMDLVMNIFEITKRFPKEER